MNAPLPIVGVPGVFSGIDNDAYHQSEGLSNTGLTQLSQSPFHYYSLTLDPNRPPRETKPGQLEGTLAHCSILEPDEFDKRYIVGPDVSRATKEWKAFAACHPEKIAIKPDQYEAAMRQGESVRRLPEVREALSAGEAETSAWWIDSETGVLCKCRPDWRHPAGEGVILLDVKTCGEAEPGEFGRHIGRKGYYRQHAWYSDGYAIASGRPVLGFVFVAVEATYPYAASAVMLDEPAIEQGRRENRRLTDLYAKCRREGVWPGYSQKIEMVSLPRYLFDNSEY
jgi:hypothetical protein